MKNWGKYQSVRRETKKAVSEARFKAFEEFYQALEIKNGERKIYKIAKRREKKTRDLDQVKCIKDEEENILVVDGDIKERWKIYFHKIFSKEQTTCINVEDLIIRVENQKFSFY